MSRSSGNCGKTTFSKSFSIPVRTRSESKFPARPPPFAEAPVSGLPLSHADSAQPTSNSLSDASRNASIHLFAVGPPDRASRSAPAIPIRKRPRRRHSHLRRNHHHRHRRQIRPADKLPPRAPPPAPSRRPKTTADPIPPQPRSAIAPRRSRLLAPYFSAAPAPPSSPPHLTKPRPARPAPAASSRSPW